MAAGPDTEQMSVFLTGKKNRAHGARDLVRVELSDCPNGFLEISLRRTVRVPHNEKQYELPPDCGNFPIYSVKEFEATLPAEMVAKGGCFLPIYRESLYPLLSCPPRSHL